MNQTILQPPYTCVHYSQASYIRYNTEPSNETSLHHYYFIVFPKLTAYLQPFNLVNPMPLVQ